MGGLQIQYTNYRIPDFNQLSIEERCGTIPNPPIALHETTLRIQWSDHASMRKCFRDNWPPKEGIKRSQDSKECLSWWSWIPHEDYRNWLYANVDWTVDPFTGYAIEEARKRNPDIKPILKAPHRSFWRAIGTYDNHFNVSTASKHDGAWQGDGERINAYKRPDLFTDDQANNRIPSYTVGNRGQGQPSGGRASSGQRSPSARRPHRRMEER